MVRCASRGEPCGGPSRTTTRCRSARTGGDKPRPSHGTNSQPPELLGDFVGATLVVARAGIPADPANGTGQARPLRPLFPARPRPGPRSGRYETRLGYEACAFAIALTALVGCDEQRDWPKRSSDANWFVEEAGARGLEFEHRSGFDGRFLFPEIMGGGVALADIDGDGDLDAYLVQSGSVEAVGDAANANRLYLNNGDGRFRVVENSGAEDRGYGMGVATGDYDNDGDVDLYVTNLGANVLLRNDGAGRFDDVTNLAGVGDNGWGTAAVFLDLDRDGDLDLFVVNYVTWALAAAKECYAVNTRTYCGPVDADAAPDRLYRNNGDGSFTDISIAAGLGRAYGTGLGVVGGDFDRDGRIDVFVANDAMVNQLWLNRTPPRGEPRLVDEAFLWGCAMDDHGAPKAGMGVSAADLDDDGDTDVLVVNLEKETDSYFRNEGGHFVDATGAVGLGVLSRRFTRFGVALTDFDNDGDLDLYEANGRVKHKPELLGRSDVFAEPNVLYQNTGGPRFEPVPQGTVNDPIHTSRGVAIGDVDNDGGVDLLVVNKDGPVYLLMNQAAKRGNWVRFRVTTASGRDAHGALVSGRVGSERQQRGVQTAGSYLAAHDPRVHFGLGELAGIVGVEVRWPTGELEHFGDFDAGVVADLRKGTGRAGR